MKLMVWITVHGAAGYKLY